MNGRVWRAWLVDDNLVDSKRTTGSLGAMGFEVDGLHTEQEFVSNLKQSVRRKVYPDLIVLDLRLPWSTSEQLAVNALTDGLRCMRMIENEPGFTHTAVLIYSAFVKSELVVSHLREFQLAHIIDKRNPEELRVVVSNLFPNALQSRKSRAGRMTRWTEATLLRVGAISLSQ